MNYTQIYLDVFTLYDVQCKLDPSLSVTKMFAYYESKPIYFDAMEYVSSMREAHRQMLNNYIYHGCKFLQLVSNPIKSKEVNYAQPDLYQKLLDQVVREREEKLNQHLAPMLEKESMRIMTESFMNGLEADDRQLEKQIMDVTYSDHENMASITQDIEEILRNDMTTSQNAQDLSIDHLNDLEDNMVGRRMKANLSPVKKDKVLFSSSMRVNMKELQLHEDSDEFLHDHGDTNQDIHGNANYFNEFSKYRLSSAKNQDEKAFIFGAEVRGSIIGGVTTGLENLKSKTYH